MDLTIYTEDYFVGQLINRFAQLIYNYAFTIPIIRWYRVRVLIFDFSHCFSPLLY